MEGTLIGVVVRDESPMTSPRQLAGMFAVAGVVLGIVVAVVVAVANDVILADCEGPTGSSRCDFKRLFGWRMDPLAADAIVIGMGAVLGAIIGLIVARVRKPSRIRMGR